VDMSSIGGKANLADKAKPLLESIPAGVYKQLATRRLETLIGLSMGSEKVGKPKTQPRRAMPQSGNLTAMSRAVLLALQHPGTIANTAAHLSEIDEDIRGADVLKKIISMCTAEPDITTARILERFRDESNHDYLSMLAVKPYYPDNRELDETMAQDEFTHCLRQLQQRSLKTDAGKVRPSARTGLLSIPKKT